MGWLSPPDRRETTLLLFCLVVYILAYNLETSLQLLGVDSVATSGALFTRIGLGKTRAIDRDGRKPKGWRDKLEHNIYGDWKWDQGHVAGNGHERAQKIGTGRHGAAWASRTEIGSVAGHRFGQISVNEALERWRDDIPQTKVLKHVPGYTVLDNVFFYNGSVYLVTDDTKNFPPVSAIVSSTGPGFGKWTLLTRTQAVNLLGQFGGVIRGVSWMAADTTPHNSTLLALWRTYTSLNSTFSTSSPNVQIPLAPPHRLIFPHSRFFTDKNPDFKDHTIRRRRVDTGFHPYLLKVAFPQLTVMYFEDLEDYAKMEGVPFVFERVVVGDRRAASKFLEVDEPDIVTPFEMRERVEREVEGEGDWWEPIRRNMVEFLDLDLDKEENSFGQREKKVVTYVVTQDMGERRPKLKKEDHEKLVSSLKKMERNVGCEVLIINEDTSRTPWTERMEAIVRSTVILGVHGDHLMEFAFMKHSPYSTLMEMYPADRFVRDRAVIAGALGQQYVAWSGTQEYTGGNFSKISRPQNHEEVPIDVDAVVERIRQIIVRT